MNYYPKFPDAFPAQYDWVSPGHVLFGWERRFDLGSLIQGEIKRVFVVSGSKILKSNGYIQELLLALNDAGVETKPLVNIHREPLVEDVDEAAARLRSFQPVQGDAVLGIGGGAAIDLAKAVAAMATNTESDTVKDYLEGVGQGYQLKNDPLPVIAMPTTAGTGSEATKNAVISSYDPPFKKSLRSPKMVPRWVIIDPEASMTLPMQQTAESGMDAITQLLESYISCRATPMSDMVCLEGLACGLPAMQTFIEETDEDLIKDARARMAQAAFLSGLALANSGLGMAHGVAAALGVHGRVNHGRACALMLPIALKTNRDVSIKKLAEVGNMTSPEVLKDEKSYVDFLIMYINELNQQLNLPSRLSEVGITHNQLPDIVSSSRGNSMNGNPRELSDAELLSILEVNL
ncbi:MAG: iron-containing alcohol dehydrogenase [Planctomycetaceae bacterium]